MCELNTFHVLQQQNLGLRFGQLNTFKSLVALAVVRSNSLLIDYRIVYVSFVFDPSFAMHFLVSFLVLQFSH